MTYLVTVEQLPIVKWKIEAEDMKAAIAIAIARHAIVSISVEQWIVKACETCGRAVSGWLVLKVFGDAGSRKIESRSFCAGSSCPSF